jgi:hypothetical protein
VGASRNWSHQETTTAPAFSQTDGRACESLPPTLTGAVANPFAPSSTETPQNCRALAKFAAPD